jgi:hypothetical protein
MHGKKISKHGWNVVIFLDKLALTIIWMIIMHWIIALTLDDHVVHDHTSIHDLSHVSRPLESGVPEDRKILLDHTK